jgi:hypothetical protein
MSVKIKTLDKTIAHLLDDSLVFLYETEKIWNPKGISLKRRVEADPAFAKKVDQVLSPANLKKYLVPVSTEAPSRCIDGRLTLGWAGFSPDQKAYLGPKIAGGTAHAALAHRIVDATSITENLLFEHDIKYIVERYKEIGIGFGGHADTHQHGWNTGCGAVDNINKILERLQKPEPQQQLRGLTKVILGDAYDGKGIVNEIIGRMQLLDAVKPSYMPKEGGRAEGEFLYKKIVVKLLRDAAGKASAVPQLEGDHNEVALVLNFARGTTLDTDRLSFDNKGEVQVFGWDVWEMYEEATRLYPYRMTRSIADQREAIERRMKHITTRTLLGVSTAMVLTDGSIKVVTINGKR